MASIASYFSFGIEIAEKNHLRMFLNFGALAANVVLNVLLIPVLGVLGAAMANAVSLGLLAVGSVTVSQRHYRVPYAWPRSLAALPVAIVVSHVVIFWDAPVSVLTVIIKITLVVSVALLLAGLLKIPLRPQVWRKLVGL
jgi:O-antigen/teichoic acid export membrane protein